MSVSSLEIAIAALQVFSIDHNNQEMEFVFQSQNGDDVWLTIEGENLTAVGCDSRIKCASAQDASRVLIAMYRGADGTNNR